MKKIPKKNDRVFLALGALGDAVMLLAFVRELYAEGNPGKNYFYVRRNAKAIGELASGIPDIVIEDISGNLSFLKTLLVSFFAHNTTVFIPTTFGTYSPSTKLFTFFWGLNTSNTTVGCYDKDHKSITGKVRYYNFSLRFIDNLREVGKLVNLKVSKLGTPPMPLPLVAIPPNIRGDYVLVHPFAANPIRSLPESKWIELCSFISATVTVVVTGTDNELNKLTTMFASMNNVIIQTDNSMYEYVGLIKSSVIYVGVDTGITHIAGVLQHPSLVIGNNSNPTWLPTYNKNALVLAESKNCGCTGDKGGNCRITTAEGTFYKCLHDISIKDMENEFARLFLLAKQQQG